MFTDDPLADFERYDAEQEEKLNRRIRCCWCHQAIQDEKAFHISNKWYHISCAEELFLEDVDE